MTEWTPSGVEREIYNAATAIADATETVRNAHERAMETSRGYERAYAIAYLDATGPQHERKYRAELIPAVMNARDERDVADAAYKYATSCARAIEKKLDALRSIGTSVRQAYSQGF